MSAGKIMMPLLAIVAIILLIGCQSDGDVSGIVGAPFQTNLAEAKAIAAERSQDILLEFYTDS
jgi:hypothetical protein